MSFARREERAGLKINIEKTKILSNRKGEDLTLDEKKTELTVRVKYLGQTVSFDKAGNTEPDKNCKFLEKILVAEKIYEGSFSLEHKGQILDFCFFLTPHFMAARSGPSLSQRKRK